MLRDALTEIRLHPGRFVATLLSIAISIGFVVAIITMVSTEQRATAMSQSISFSKADIVVTPDHTVDAEELLKAVESSDGVAAVETTSQTMGEVKFGQNSMYLSLYSVPSEPFRWAKIADGRYPEGDGEIALSTAVLKKLGANVGDTVTIYDQEMSIVGSTKDARSLFTGTGYADFGDMEFTGTILVQTDGADVDQVISAIRANTSSLSGTGETLVENVDAYQSDALNNLTGEFDVFRNLLLGFAAIALVVGIIIISNTFTILVTQRRRQIGLLRAVGASSSQVRGRLVWEALLIGLIGSLLGVLLGLGVAWVGSMITGSAFWGLVIKPVELLISIGVGVLITLVSVIGPSFTATRVTPLEALQVVPTAKQSKRIGIVRAVVCGLFLVAGVALVVISRMQPTYGLAWAVLAGMCLSVAILFGAPLYIAPILRGIGKLFSFAGPTTRLAAENGARNPRRAAATAVALMLAVGLIVTIQVALASARESAMAEINKAYPIDVIVAPGEALSQSFIDDVRNSGGAKDVVEIHGKEVISDYSTLFIVDAESARAAWGLDSSPVADGKIRDGSSLGLPIDVPTSNGTVTLTGIDSGDLGYSFAEVSPSLYPQVTGEEQVYGLWVRLTDRTSTTALNQVTAAITKTYPEAANMGQLDGGAMMAGILEQILNVVMIVMTALLGVAVVIALVGVGNTLALSVLERQRESALLRALGMQRGGLRAMLLIEAMLISLVGVVIGIIAGAFFGWLGISSALRMFGTEEVPELHYTVDLGWTALILGVCITAAALASILPGRRAANATPTEALAAD